jgi:cob(I)alamin adenosyltransferase
VVLDELNIALRYRYVDVEAVLAALRARPAAQHVVITGRGAPPRLLEAADTVTDMRQVKHAFDAGVRAQRGIEL